MKDTQHTPGPWTYGADDAAKTEWAVFHDSGAVCRLYRGGEPFRHEANARLIAAAPDLLNLMTAATRLDELTGENLAVYARTFASLARAAIARATGNQ